MSTHKYIDRICCAALALALLLTALLMNGEAIGLQAASRVMGYESRLFDTSKVHTIDVVMDDWDTFIANCTDKEYAACALVIDGEVYKNVAIRGKGNYSMQVAENDRYSFKVEFDHYDSGKTYYGLDKLALNNISMDKTYLKDYLAYQLLDQFGVASPLCSFVYITVNGRDHGLYLAVEGVEDGFLRRNYGLDAGNLYKPDSSLDFGAMGGFSFEDVGMGEDWDWPDPDTLPESFDWTGNGDWNWDWDQMDPDALPESFDWIGDGDWSWDWDQMDQDALPESFDWNADDVKLKYIDDDPDSYPAIFDNAKTKTDIAAQKRLIAALKALSSGENISQVVDVEQVIRYFVVHTFVCNSDSYTGSIVHNYYLHEKDGVLSMIPWDYNLAFGDCFNFAATASSVVNAPIDLFIEDRPMLAWIFNDENYLALYHQYYQEFLDAYLTSGKLADMIDSTVTLISPYVERDPTRPYTYAEYETGVAALKEFCRLRGESVTGQLNGTIPSTSEGQEADPSALVDASGIELADMGDTIAAQWGKWSDEAGEGGKP